MSKKADGAIRVTVVTDSTDAKKELEIFQKEAQETASSLEKLGKDADIAIDIKQAERQLARLEKEIERYQAKLNELNNGKLKDYNTEKASIIADTDKSLEKAMTDDQAKNVLEMEKITIAQLDDKYEKIINKAKEYTRQIEEATKQKKDLVQQLNNANQEEAKTKSAADKTNQSLHSTQNAVKLINNQLKRSSKNTANTSRHADKARNIFSKIGRVISAKVNTELKSSLTRLKAMGAGADNLRKKMMKIGLAMLGMRGIMGGLRQMISSVMSNNETLQKQLTATKGVMSEAFTPVIKVLVDGLAQIVTFADQIYQLFTGTSLIAKYNAKQAQKIADSTSDAANSAKEYKKQMASFDVAKALTDNSNNQNSNLNSADTGAALFKETDISSWLNDILTQIKKGNWYGVGKEIAEKINEGLRKINWELTEEKAKELAANIASAINGFFENLDAKEVGEAIAGLINTATGAIHEFFTTTDFETIGKKIGEIISEAIKKIKPEQLGQALTDWFNALITSLDSTLEEMKKNNSFDDLGSKLAKTLLSAIRNVKWDKMASLLSNIVIGICEAVAGFFDKLSEGDEGYETVKDAIIGFFANIKFKDITIALGKLIVSYAKLVTELSEKASSDFFNWIYKKITGESPSEGATETFTSATQFVFSLTNPIKFMMRLISAIADKDSKLWKFIKKLTGKNDEEDAMAALAGASGDEIKRQADNKIETECSIKAVFSGIAEKTFSEISEQIENLKGKTVEIKAEIATKWSDLKEKWTKLLANAKGKTAEIKAKIGTTWNSLKEKWNNLKKKFTGKTVSFTVTFKDAMTKAINTLISRLNSVITKLKSISVAGIKPFSSMSYIPRLAKGAIVNNPGRGVTATIGEAGREAVLPLDNNTAWMDELANRLAEKIGSSYITVYSVLNGRVIGKAVADYNRNQKMITNGVTI